MAKRIAHTRYANTNIIKALLNKYIASKLKETRTTENKMDFYFPSICLCVCVHVHIEDKNTKYFSPVRLYTFVPRVEHSITELFSRADPRLLP
jgi:hypothetical protein